MCFVVPIEHGTATGNECSTMVCIWLTMNSCLILVWTENASYNWTGWLRMMQCLASVWKREAKGHQCCASWC